MELSPQEPSALEQTNEFGRRRHILELMEKFAFASFRLRDGRISAHAQEMPMIEGLGANIAEAHIDCLRLLFFGLCALEDNGIELPEPGKLPAGGIALQPGTEYKVDATIPELLNIGVSNTPSASSAPPCVLKEILIGPATESPPAPESAGSSAPEAERSDLSVNNEDNSEIERLLDRIRLLAQRSMLAARRAAHRDVRVAASEALALNASCEEMASEVNESRISNPEIAIEVRSVCLRPGVMTYTASGEDSETGQSIFTEVRVREQT